MEDKEFSAILHDDPLQPLALVPLTEEEQVGGFSGRLLRSWSLALLVSLVLF